QQRHNVADFPRDMACKQALAGNYRALAYVFRLDRRPAEAVDALLEARKLAAGNPLLLYKIGCDLAQSATLVGGDKNELTPSQRDEYRKDQGLAMDVLRQAIASGFRDRSQLEKNPDLARLRQRDDFKALLASLMK